MGNFCITRPRRSGTGPLDSFHGVGLIGGCAGGGGGNHGRRGGIGGGLGGFGLGGWGWELSGGGDGFAFFGKIIGNRIILKRLEGRDDDFGVNDGAIPAGVDGFGTGVAALGGGFSGGGDVQEVHFVFANFLVFAGEQFIEINEADVFGVSDLAGEDSKVGVTINVLATGVPAFAGDEGTNDGGGALGAGGGDHLVHIPTIGMDDFGLAGAIGDCLGFVADAAEFTDAGSGLTAVVGAELHDDDIALFNEVHHVFPIPIVKAAGAGTAEGAVDDVDFGRVEIKSERSAPAPLAIRSIGGAIAGSAIADGGVADEPESREFVVNWDGRGVATGTWAGLGAHVESVGVGGWAGTATGVSVGGI